MAGLAFQAILANGSRALGDGTGPEGEGIYDVFFNNIDLSGFVDRPALLVLATQDVGFEKNFITLNAPPEVRDQSFDEASGAGYFLWRVLPNPSHTWILQVHQVGIEKLKATGNVLGIHTRNEKGEQARVRDSFAVARLFIVYSSE